MERSSGSSDGGNSGAEVSEDSERLPILGDWPNLAAAIDAKVRRLTNPFLADLPEFQAILGRIGEVCEIGPSGGCLSDQGERSVCSHSTTEEHVGARMAVEPGSSAPSSSNLSPYGKNNDSDTRSAFGQTIRETLSTSGIAPQNEGQEIGAALAEDSKTSKTPLTSAEDADGTQSTAGVPGTCASQVLSVIQGHQGTGAPSSSIDTLIAGIGSIVHQSSTGSSSKEETGPAGSLANMRPGSPGNDTSMEEGLNLERGTKEVASPPKNIYILTTRTGSYRVSSDREGTGMSGFPSSSRTETASSDDEVGLDSDQSIQQIEDPSRIDALTAGMSTYVEYHIGATAFSGSSSNSRSPVIHPIVQGGVEAVGCIQCADSTYMNIDPLAADISTHTEYRLGPEKAVPEFGRFSGFVSNSRLQNERDQKEKPPGEENPSGADTSLLNSFVVSESPVTQRDCFLCPIHSDQQHSRIPDPAPFPYVSHLSTPSNMDLFRSSTPVNDPSSAILREPAISGSPVSPSTAISSDISLNPPEFNNDVSSVGPNTDYPANRSLIGRFLASCCCGMGMKLRCFEGNSGANSYFLLENLGADKDSATEKQEELQFFDDNGCFVSVVVEKNLRAIDLTQLLAVKNRVRKDYCWSIVEHWVEIGIERVLEDHEDVLSVHRQTEGAAKKYIFRRYPNKYDFFFKPEDFFPPDMIDCKTYEPGFMYPEKHPEQLEIVLTTADVLPVIFSQVNFRQDSHSNVWVKTFLILKGSKILMSSTVQVVAKFLRAWRDTTSGYRPLEGETSIDQDDGLEQYVGIGEGNEEELEVLADLKDYEVYTSLNAKNQLKSPTEFGVVLRKTNEEDFADPVVLSFDKGKDRVCWVTAMRLAKYGKQLRENYKAFKNKQETISANGSAAALNESVRSRVAMDFTGKVGRIVDDPTEAKAIAVSEGNAWKKRLRAKAESSSRCGGVPTEAEEEKAHHSQPWYHKNMSREQATALISAHAKYDGVFVVRGSRSQPGNNVLSFKSQEKVIHLSISMVEDPLDKIMCYTIDNGSTKFYDICQLVEFYRLNAGPLPTRLSNHLEKLPQVRTPGTSKNHSDHQ